MLIKKKVDIGHFKKFDLGGLLREQGSGVGLGWRDDFLISLVQILSALGSHISRGFVLPKAHISGRKGLYTLKRDHFL